MCILYDMETFPNSPFYYIVLHIYNETLVQTTRLVLSYVFTILFLVFTTWMGVMHIRQFLLLLFWNMLESMIRLDFTHCSLLAFLVIFLGTYIIQNSHSFFPDYIIELNVLSALYIQPEYSNLGVWLELYWITHKSIFSTFYFPM